jgi:hypothetical protein
MAEFSVNAKVTGILQNTDYLDKWQQHPDVLYARPLVQVGQGGGKHQLRADSTRTVTL